MNRILSFGIMLFSFAMVILGYKPSDNPVSTGIIPAFELPKLSYQIVGVAAMLVGLTFIAMAGKANWAKTADKWLNIPAIYPVWFIIYEGLYTLSFLKGFINIFNSSQPAWIRYAVFYVGYALVFYILFIFIKYTPKRTQNANVKPVTKADLQ
jgi:hypothetical protein